MQADQHAVRAKLQRVAHDVCARRNIEHRVFGDGLLDGGRFVGHAVALHAQRAQVHPRGGWRQGPDGIRQGRRHGGQRRGIEARLDFADSAQRRQRESVGEDLHLVNRAAPGQFAPAFAEPREHGHAAADHVLHVDLGHAVLLVRNHHRGPADVFEARILHPQLVGVARVDGNRGGDIAELVVHQRQPRFVLANGRFALPVERRIDQRELPRRRRFARQNAIPSAVKMQVLGLVADVVQPRQAGADLEIDVRQVGVLCRVETDSDRARVVAADLEIHVAHGRIKRARPGIRHPRHRRHRPRRRRQRAEIMPATGPSGPARPHRVSAAARRRRKTCRRSPAEIPESRPPARIPAASLHSR